MHSLVLIPARMASTRLPGKPAISANGLPMIVHVARRARESGLGRVAVATDAAEIATAVRDAGFEAVMTDAGHRSGSDRIKEALDLLDPGGEFDTIINLQGDLPTIEPDTIRAAARPLEDADVDIGTVAVEIADNAERTDPNVTKAVGTPVAEGRMRALYFTRACAPWGDGVHYHHVGIYAYRRAALERFVALPPSPLEEREHLEQLRALEAGMRIDIEIVDAVPLGVDTSEQLERAREILTRRSGGQ
jgi:3-deoxy-manno-octulosonate cytidylyltransferase (CMP-KDO synthetase)